MSDQDQTFTFDRDPEVCQGGTPETMPNRKRGKRAEAKPANGHGDATNGVASLSDDPSASNGDAVIDPVAGSGAWYPPKGMLDILSNGTHDRDAAAGILPDPDRVMATLTEKGWKIAYTHAGDGRPGEYINNESGFPYNTWDVEAAYRAALGDRGGS